MARLPRAIDRPHRCREGLTHLPQARDRLGTLRNGQLEGRGKPNGARHILDRRQTPQRRARHHHLADFVGHARDEIAMRQRAADEKPPSHLIVG